MNFRSILFLFISSLGASFTSAQTELLYLSNQTPTYNQVISFYQDLDAQHDEAKLIAYSKSDAGPPIHLFILDNEKKFDPKDDRATILIMNGIHAGEPCGVDASMNFAKDLLDKGELPKNTVIAIIPIYNIGGALNRNSASRTNQEGPLEHGFRGNAKNLDLNRDFIKNDSKNARAFSQLFSEWNPEIFIDTHTSNGADYQSPFTLIATQKDKLNPLIRDYMYGELNPYLYEKMNAQGVYMIPYMNVFGRSPDSGISGFIDYPRYSTGYAALFNTMAFTTEAHMLKPFQTRVEATLTFIDLVVEYTEEHSNTIVQNKHLADQQIANETTVDLNWELDDSTSHLIEFKGYKAETKISEVSGLPRLYYDRSRPFTDSIVYKDTYRPTVTVDKPEFYIIPQAWTEVIERLQNNNVAMKRFENDTTLMATLYYIDEYKTSESVYEGHYLHYQVSINEKVDEMIIRAGDYLIPMGQTSDYYTVSVLDPRGVDSFFAWNFFDPILQQKEWFSSYVFEDEASEMLKNDPLLREELEKKKTEDEVFRESAFAQLYFIYQRSEHYEKEHLRYPVYRIE